MLKPLLSSALLILLFVVFTAADVYQPGLPYQKTDKQEIKQLINAPNSTSPIRHSTAATEGGIIFMEDFEGSSGYTWISDDLTSPRPVRGEGVAVVDSWMALGDSSWHLADTSLGNNGGYGNHWYQVLDTPPIMVGDTSAVLSFYHRYSIEGPEGASDASGGLYDGWDGINVRVSVDSGATWMVMPHESYNVTSSWAFGHPDQGHFEYVPGIHTDPIPSWGGDLLEWTKVEFPLKDYVGSGGAIMIRFALASDMAYSTAYDPDGNFNPDLFGWQLDSITVATADSIYFFNDGQTKGMSPADNEFIAPEGGDLWHTAMFDSPLDAYAPEFAASPTHSAIAQNGGESFDFEATYNSWMDNVFETGPIALPDTSPIYLDFNHIPYFADEDQFPDVEYWRVEVRAADSTNWEAVWIGDQGEQWVFSDGFDQWIGFASFFGYPVNMSPLELSRFAGQEVYIRFRFWSDYDEPIGLGLMVDDVVIYAPITPPDPPTGLTVMPSPEDTSIVLHWDFEQGKSYQVWRTTPGDQYLHLIDEVTDSMYVDRDIDFFQVYYYTLKASVKYQGTSDFSSPLYGTEVIPKTIVEVAYDDSDPDTTVVANPNKMVLVKFTPEAYPMDLKGININLDATGTVGTAAQFTIWDDDGADGLPGTRLRFLNKSGLLEGWNRIIFEDSVAIDSGSFFVGYKRFGNGLKVAADLDTVIDGNTYLETDTSYAQVTDRDALIHVFMDTARTDFPVGIYRRLAQMSEQYYLGKNYPNPFNPVTTIPFNVPAAAAGQDVELSVYNVIGQKVVTLFKGKPTAGLHQVSWNGQNGMGRSVSSGIYIYQLKGKNVALTRRMLLIK